VTWTFYVSIIISYYYVKIGIIWALNYN